MSKNFWSQTRKNAAVTFFKPSTASKNIFVAPFEIAVASKIKNENFWSLRSPDLNTWWTVASPEGSVEVALFPQLNSTQMAQSKIWTHIKTTLDSLPEPTGLRTFRKSFGTWPALSTQIKNSDTKKWFLDIQYTHPENSLSGKTCRHLKKWIRFQQVINHEKASPNIELPKDIEVLNLECRISWQSKPNSSGSNTAIKYKISSLPIPLMHATSKTFPLVTHSDSLSLSVINEMQKYVIEAGKDL